MAESLRFGAVVLAAGASTRMGTPKPLLPVGGGTLIRRVVAAVLASPAWPVVIVLGARAELIRPELVRLPVLLVENPAWSEGLTSSIRVGMGVLESFSLSIEAAVLVLGDQPGLSPGALTRLAATQLQSGQSIVAARYEGHPGPPVLFTRGHFPELLELRGPGGARPLLARHADRLATIDLPEFAVDLDTPEDYRTFLARQAAPPGAQP